MSRAAALLFILAPVLLFIPAVLRAQSVAPAPPDLAEQIEAGRTRLPGGAEVVYRIRLLPVASFPSLPAGIAGQLREKDCMVPQTYAAREPENVIRGAFEKRGSDDWAVLCSMNGTTSLYVFFQSQPDQPIMLRRQRDAEWLGAEVVGQYGSAWGISTRNPSQIRSSNPGRHAETIDHAGIEDAFVEHSASIHYFRDGGWVTLDGGN
jgi:hypothetical protein